MSAVSTQKWHEHAHRNMAEAQMAHQGALDQAEESVRTHEGTVNDNHDMYKEVHDSMEQKVSNTRRLVENLTDRAYCLENSIQHTRESQGQLEAALRAKDAPLQLCLWRLEQRSKRPPREQVRDDVELALEEEKATLIQTKWDLSDAIERTKAMINEMENRLAEVRDDLHHKQHALGIDEMCLAKAQSSYHTMAFRTPRPQGPTLGGKTAGSKRQSGLFPHVEAHNNEVFRQNRTGQLERHAASHDEAADVLREQNTRLIARCEKAANDAKASTDRCLRDRVHECQQMRMRLEDQIRETESKIDHTNGIISETRFHMGALQEPLAMVGACGSFRKDRTAREHITDPVSTKLQEHQDTVMRAHEDLADQHQKEKDNLQRLWERKKQLEEDLKDKTTACHIDSRCLNHGTLPIRGGDRGTIGPVGDFEPLHQRAADYQRSYGMPLPNHGDPLPGRGGHTARGAFLDPAFDGRGGSDHTHRGFNAQGASTPGRAGTFSPGYTSTGRTMNQLASHTLAPVTSPMNSQKYGVTQRGSGTMTPRTFGAAGSNIFRDTARAAMTYG